MYIELFCTVGVAQNGYIYRWCRRGRVGTRAHALLAPGGLVSAASQLRGRWIIPNNNHANRNMMSVYVWGGGRKERERERENNH